MKKILLLIIAAFSAAGAIVAQISFPPDRKLAFAEQIIANYYVDTVDTAHVVEEAIVGMLKTLDPHSTYTNAEETRALTEPLDGNFSGIGIRFQMVRDTLYVIESVSGGPSERMGIQPGDRIISCNDTVIAGQGMKNSEILKTLRGPRGTLANLKVKRNRHPELLDFKVIREDIPIYSVDASYMVNDSVGFISLSRFAGTTADEVKDAMKKLRKRGMKHLMIDLADNGGGYLKPSTQIANMFLRKGDMLVYTDSPKNGVSRYEAEEDGDFLTGRLVIMVNQNSASASEILAGAIQDNDRGVIVGRRTFGKGLVQRPFPFPDGSMMRLTVSRYHTPSGRCIQKPYINGDDIGYRQDMYTRLQSGEFMYADSVHMADSLLYHTIHLKRPVYGGGGIMPDHFVPIDTTYYSDYYRDLVARGVINSYTVGYVDRNRSELNSLYRNEDSFVDRFQVTPEMEKELVDAATVEGIEYDEGQFAVSRDMILAVVKGLIGRDLFEQSIYYRVVNPLNPLFNHSVDVICDPAHYRKHLSVQ